MLFIPTSTEGKNSHRLFKIVDLVVFLRFATFLFVPNFAELITFFFTVFLYARII